jgi:hypothetical protein
MHSESVRGDRVGIRALCMGTTHSPFPYDAAAPHAILSASLRRPGISLYTSRVTFGRGALFYQNP